MVAFDQTLLADDADDELGVAQGQADMFQDLGRSGRVREAAHLGQVLSPLGEIIADPLDGGREYHFLRADVEVLAGHNVYQLVQRQHQELLRINHPLKQTPFEKLPVPTEKFWRV